MARSLYSMVEDVEFKFTPSEAKEIIFDALKPLGKIYRKVLEKAFEERWIDWFSNKGKRSGAYSSSSYDGKPYTSNWQGTLDAVYTLAHELGHSSIPICLNLNHLFIADIQYFLAEIASTTMRIF